MFEKSVQNRKLHFENAIFLVKNFENQNHSIHEKNGEIFPFMAFQNVSFEILK